MTESLAALSQSFAELNTRIQSVETQQQALATHHQEFAAQQQAYALQQADEHAKHSTRFDRIMTVLEAMHVNTAMPNRLDKQPMVEETPQTRPTAPLLSTPVTYVSNNSPMQQLTNGNQEIQCFQAEAGH
ncbi:unnamed protein product [Rhodiola kirilowii]